MAVVQDLAAGRLDEIRDRFDDAMTAAVSKSRMEEVWGQVVASSGAFVAAGEPLSVFDVPLHFERGNAHVQVAFQDGRIAGLFIRPGDPTGHIGK